MSNLGDYRKLTSEEVQRELSKLKNWKILKGKLHRELDFRSFEDAIAFIVRASMEVSKLDHHPEWSNVYNHIAIDLVTHDVRGISHYDFHLAKLINDVLRDYKIK